jgi:hypothetical protein
MLSWLVKEWIGITADYIIAGLAVAIGIALAFGLPAAAASTGLPPWAVKLLGFLLVPLRYIGYGLIALGLIKGAVTYGKTLGSADCQAAWQAKNYEQQIVNLKRDLAAQKSAAEFKAQEAKDLAAQKANADEQITAYANYAAGLSTSLSACRRATADDDRRLCDIIGNAAPGCKPAR